MSHRAAMVIALFMTAIGLLNGAAALNDTAWWLRALNVLSAAWMGCLATYWYHRAFRGIWRDR